MNTKVTVGIPVFNGEKYLPEALKSVADQTHHVDCLLICDNNSTDNTIKIVEKFILDNPKLTVELHRNKVNIGADDNFNKCMELCSTKFLVLLGADDRLKPYAVEKQLELFKKMPQLGLVGGLFQAIDHEGNFRSDLKEQETIIFEKGDVLEFAKQTKFYIQHSTVMFNMECTRKVGFFDTRYIANDERLYVSHLLEFPIAQLGTVLADARFHKGQATFDENSRFKEKILHFKSNLEMANFESTPERVLATKKILKKWIVAQCSTIAGGIIRDGKNRKTAFNYWLYGIKQDPACLITTPYLRNIFFALYVSRKSKVQPV
jgi:glycosyltransferase involved in cell wall biosynthesis